MSKVLHLITRLDPGGSAENTISSCQCLARDGWDVVLAAGPGKTSDRSWVEESTVSTFEVRALRRDPHPFADLLAFWQLFRLMRKERPDILHTHSAKAGILGRWAGKLARVPHIVHTPHGHVLYGYARGAKNWLYLMAERVTAPLTDRLVALTEGERRESVESGIGRSGQWVVIHSGVALTLLPQDPAADSDGGIEEAGASSSTGPAAERNLRIGVVARLEYVKGLDLLVEATSHLCSQGSCTSLPFEIVLWGDGELEEVLRKLVQTEGLSDRVRLVGTVEPVDSFLSSLDIYVQPSRNEGMGRALVLAQASGLPVVATKVCGIPDVVKAGKSGILVEPEDPIDLAMGLEQLIVDSSLRDRLAGEAKEWIAAVDESGFPRFSVEAMVWHLERLYEQLVGSTE